MSFDIETLNLDDTPIEGLDAAFEQWQEPPEFPPALAPGKHTAIISDLREGSIDPVTKALKLTLDFECKGGTEDGEKITFQRLSSKMFQRRDGVNSSQILDMVKSSGIEGSPKSVKDLRDMVKHIMDTNRTVNFQSDLRTYCATCASNALLAATGEQTDEAAKEALQVLVNTDPPAAKKVYDAVRKAAEKHKNYKAIPVNAQTGRHVDSVECPTCKSELRVNATITRWLRPSAGLVAAGSEVPF